MDFTMQNATLEDLNELSLLMNQAHKTMEHPEWFAADDDVYLKKHLEKHGFIVTARTKDKTLSGFFVIKYPAVSENYLGQILNFSDTQMQQTVYMDSGKPSAGSYASKCRSTIKTSVSTLPVSDNRTSR